MKRTLKSASPLSWDATTSWEYAYPSITFLSSSSGRIVDKLPLGDGNERDFGFNFFSMNGTWSQVIKFRRVNGVWVQALQGYDNWEAKTKDPA